MPVKKSDPFSCHWVTAVHSTGSNDRSRNRIIGALFGGLLLGASLRAAEPTYWTDVRPILRKHCIVCHNERNIRDAELSGRLALDTFEAIRKGGKTAVIQMGRGDDSLLVSILRHPKKERRMPLDADPLDDESVTVLRKWIDAGAKEGTKPSTLEAEESSPASAVRRRLDVAIPTKLQKPPKLEFVLAIGPLAPVAAVAYSPDGRLLAVGAYGLATIWDTESGKPLLTITQLLGAVNDLKFSPDGAILAVAGGQPSARGDLRLFDVRTGRLIVSLGGHADVVGCVSFTRDGKRLASASFDKTVRIWDLTTRQNIGVFSGHSDFVYSVAFSPKGDWFVSASKDRTVRLVDAKTMASRLTFSGMENDVLCVAVSPDGTQVVTSGYEAALHWWDPKTAERTRRQTGHDIATHELVFDREGKHIVSAGGDRTLRIWNGQTGASLRSIPTGSVVFASAIRPDGGQVAAGCADGFVRIYDTATARHLVSLVHVPSDGGKTDWLVQCPDAYFTASDGLRSRVRWRSTGPLPANSVMASTLNKPDQLAHAWRGDKLIEPVIATPK
jgi:DNA-binding beta-propeller fold protein YncE